MSVDHLVQKNVDHLVVPFDKYKAAKGELPQQQYEAVRVYQPNVVDVRVADSFKSSFEKGHPSATQLINEDDLVVMAKLLGTLHKVAPERTRADNVLWILAETYLSQGKSPYPIFEADLDSIGLGEKSGK